MAKEAKTYRSCIECHKDITKPKGYERTHDKCREVRRLRQWKTAAERLRDKQYKQGDVAPMVFTHGKLTRWARTHPVQALKVIKGRETKAAVAARKLLEPLAENVKTAKVKKAA